MIQAGTKKKLSPLQVSNPMTSQTPAGRSIYWAKRPDGEQGHLTELMCSSTLHISTNLRTTYMMIIATILKGLGHAILGNFV